VFEPHRQHTAPARRSYSERRGAFAGVPNTLPPQDLNRSAKLGRVGCSAPKSPRSGSAASLGRARHKTSFYNMLGNQGQTGRAAASTFHSVIPSSARDLAGSFISHPQSNRQSRRPSFNLLADGFVLAVEGHGFSRAANRDAALAAEGTRSLAWSLLRKGSFV
jgi:hypothetical protein